METVLVTGANGFIGRVLCDVLAASGRGVRKAVRTHRADAADAVAVGDIGADTDWRAALEGVGCVVHLAARTHVLRETAADPLADYRRINVAATERLARAAAELGVWRFVFLSSAKVHGDSSGSRPFTEEDTPRPEDNYGVSKWEAEQALARVSAETGLQVVVLRPPLVYGPGVKGNFLRLMNLVARGVPLPLGAVDNRRSFIYTDNLAGAIIKALDAPQAAGRTFLVSDGEDVSTPDLVQEIGRALGKDAWLFPCPVGLLKAAAALAGKRPEAARLAGSLQLDSSRIRRELLWRTPYSFSEGLQKTAQWFKSRES
jgi:nucleoside-diphosphate-sugar epimerase